MLGLNWRLTAPRDELGGKTWVVQYNGGNVLDQPND
jgi:hypothetical protein